MKYVRFKNRGFVLFETEQSHAEFAKMIGDEVVSAGFVRTLEWVDKGQPVCSGESHSLKVSASDADTEALRRKLER